MQFVPACNTNEEEFGASAPACLGVFSEAIIF
jgi:hypothetical protein